jgi:hypothetical protein
MLRNRKSSTAAKYNLFEGSLTTAVEDTVRGVVNFFGDFEPKSVGDSDEDKISWYYKVYPYLTV